MELPLSSLTYEICDDIFKKIKETEIVVTILSNYIIDKKKPKESQVLWAFLLER